MKRIMSVSAVLLLLVALPACGTTKKQLRKDNADLGQQVAQLQNQTMQQQQQAQELQRMLVEEQQRSNMLQQQVAVAGSRSTSFSSTAGVSAPTTSASGAVTTKAGEKFISEKISPQPTVSDVQAALKNAGFYKGDVDGKPGPQSVAAVKAFQKSNGLVADGVIGRMTWDKLKSYR